MGTLPAWWTEPYPEVSSTKTAADYLDGLGAALNRREEDGSWVLSTGEQELITADTQEELDSFLLGFALAHVICERHGPIGQRSGPTRLPHPSEIEEPAAAGVAEEDGPSDESVSDAIGEATGGSEDVDAGGEDVDDRDEDQDG
jgi:hypothetical protein